MEPGLKLLKDLLLIIRKLVYGVESTTRVKRFSQEQDINLKEEGAGKGVRAFTVRNLGGHIMFISTSPIDEREPILPGQHFIINTETRVCDEQIKIEFDENPYPNNPTPFTGKEGIIRFVVEKC